MGVFTATSVTQAHRGASWSEIVTSQLGTSITEAIGREDDFYGNLALWSLGSLRLAHVKLRGTPVRGVRRADGVNCSTQSPLWLAVALAGTFELEYETEGALMEPGMMAILDPTRTYVSTFGPHNDVLWVRLPKSYLDPYLAGPRQIIIDGSRGTGRVAFDSLHAALGEAGRLLTYDGQPVGDAILKLIAAAISHTRGEYLTVPSEYRALTRQRIKTFIKENLSDETLSARTIADAQGLSVRYLNKLFEDEGTSLMRWTWTQRLARAKEILEHPSSERQLISDIAYAFGFKSVSHFSHAFKSHYGFPPSKLRR